MRDLKVKIIQASLVWENIEQNLKNFDLEIAQIQEPSDLIVLPEMFSTGFTMNVHRCAETEEGEAVKWMKEKAGENNCVVAGSLLIKDNNKFFNRFFWMKPDGNYETYDKRHLFRMSEEHLTMSAGMNRIIAELNNWKFNLQICYDLRFPVWSKNNFKAGLYDYDVLIYVANWPEVRSHAYKSLLKARAIENQSYVIWANRVGMDNKQIFHSGDSMVIDPYGKIIAQAEAGKEERLSAILSGQLLEDFRTKFRLGDDWDHFVVEH
jgi:predicted amidohydrolase